MLTPSLSPHLASRTMIFDPSGDTIIAFLNSDKFVRGIMGPLGSGKSSACVVEILRRSMAQRISPDGFRRTRWAVIRNSYPELQTTTLKTWGEWCPREYGRMNMGHPITHYIKTPELDMEVLFMALDREEDVKKLLSLELTGAWINEAREVPKAILDALTGRVGRYPSKQMGGASWSGILLDTNPPDDQSWWYKLAEETPPDGWEFFRQAAGDGPKAENLTNLPPDYYHRISQGKSDEWVKVYVRGEYGYLIEGKVCYPMFSENTHISKSILEPNKDIALELGVDFGLTPAAIIGQKLVDGRWVILDELTAENCGVSRFGEVLAKYLRTHYPEHSVSTIWGDPAGGARDGNERTALEILREKMGCRVKAAPTNELTMRLEVVIAALNRLVDGKPGLLVSPKAKMLRKGFSSGYHYRSVKTGNGAQYHDTPAKNMYSHSHDALQYLLLGGGEADVVMNKVRRRVRGETQVARDVDYQVFSH